MLPAEKPSKGSLITSMSPWCGDFRLKKKQWGLPRGPSVCIPAPGTRIKGKPAVLGPLGVLVCAGEVSERWESRAVQVAPPHRQPLARRPGGGAVRQPICAAPRHWPDPPVFSQGAAGIGCGAVAVGRGQHGGRRELAGERGEGRRAPRGPGGQRELTGLCPPAAAAVVRGLLVGVEALPRAAPRLPPLLHARGAAGLRPLAGGLRGLSRLGAGPRRRRAGTAGQVPPGPVCPGSERLRTRHGEGLENRAATWG